MSSNSSKKNAADRKEKLYRLKARLNSQAKPNTTHVSGAAYICRERETHTHKFLRPSVSSAEIRETNVIPRVPQLKE